MDWIGGVGRVESGWSVFIETDRQTDRESDTFGMGESNMRAVAAASLLRWFARPRLAARSYFNTAGSIILARGLGC